MTLNLKNYLNLTQFMSRVPNKEMIAFGAVRQTDNRCLDTLGNLSGGTLGLFECHDSGGNQVTSAPHCNHVTKNIIAW